MGKSTDFRKSFQAVSNLHVVNKSSVDLLRQKVADNHPEGIENFYIDAEQFRPNIVIDLEAFKEDEICEMR